ncbi:MAG: alpha/beta hydrolase fold protein [Ferruginibacter sp.]|nr:alpha/beta hydrolase fold protein [Ferruginibacter sp.]
MNRRIQFLIVLVALSFYSAAQVSYPYPIQYIQITVEQKKVSMAYMDLASPRPNGKTILLFHGKNFNGYYWKDIIPALIEKGYRVIVPDQLGWGRSDKPDLHYSFHMLANNNKLLLDSLKVERVAVLGHSMGGMLAIRFALMFPAVTEKLVLENPIGLEDYKTFVPYQPLEKIFSKENAATYESYKKYQQSYYPQWKPAYEQYVAAQAEALSDTGFHNIAWVNAITYQMIYEQPVVYELNRIVAPTLLIIGQADRTVVGKDLLNDAKKKEHGQYPLLGKMAHQRIANSILVELRGIGHIPHIQATAQFKQALFKFL